MFEKEKDIDLNFIPLPPSMNHAYPTNRRTGMRFKSSEYKSWERELNLWALQNKPQINQVKEKLKEVKESHQKVISIRTDFYFLKSSIITQKNKPKIHDTSNRLKILHDGISNLIEIDDCYFWHGSYTKNVTKSPNAYCHISFELCPMILSE